MRQGQGHRSHRPASGGEADEWGDGSWVVDCVCGVNFDDGEEMVNCDECGVWVHTRCSRFVKSDSSFVCDKCKSNRHRHDTTEETEVAQLLAELPTKAAPPPPPPLPLPMERESAFPLLIPMEERVHVQGVPGGDPALFQGFVSARVFSPYIWKATGYVPKKLNFQYKEFPAWDKENVQQLPPAVTALEEEAVQFDGNGGDNCDRDGGKDRFSTALADPEDKGLAIHHRRHHSQGLKAEKHHHHHGHHHHGKRKKEDGRGNREHGAKKKVKSSGENEKSKKKETTKLLWQGQGQGPGHVVYKNPKSMRNIAAQKFLDDAIKSRSGSSGCQRAETHEPACHDAVTWATHEKIEVDYCQIKEVFAKRTSLANRGLKIEECRRTESRDAEVDIIFKKHEAKKIMEKSKLKPVLRTRSTEILNESSICSMSSELEVKSDAKDCQSTGKMGKLFPSARLVNVQPQESENVEVKIKQEDVKSTEDDIETNNFGKCILDLGTSSHPAVDGIHAVDSEFASSKSLSGNHPVVDPFPNQFVTSPAIKDEPTVLDVKPLSFSYTNNRRDMSVKEGSKLQRESDEPVVFSQPKQSAFGNSLPKQISPLSGLVGRSLRPDDVLQSIKQEPVGQKQLDDHFQAIKNDEDIASEAGQSRDNVGGSDSAKPIPVEAAFHDDDLKSEEQQCKLEQSCQGVAEQVTLSSLHSSVLQQESFLHRARLTSAASIYSTNALGTEDDKTLSAQVSNPRSLSGSSKSNPGIIQLHKNGAGGVGRASNSSSMSRSPIPGPISVVDSKSSGQPGKSLINLVSSSSTMKAVHLSKQRFKLGNSTDLKEDAGNTIGKCLTAASPGRVSPELSSLEPVVKENTKSSTNLMAKALSHGKSSSQSGSSKQAASNSRGHNSFPSSKSCAGHNLSLCSSSAEQDPAVQPQHHMPTQMKQVNSEASHKNEKSCLLASQSVTRANTAFPPAHPQVSNSISATLSDQELALLLHQELNSSPRVPRLSRVRHTGNISHPTSSTPLSGSFVKRPTAVTPQSNSVCGQKDHAVVSRRRNKEDYAREGSHVHGLDDLMKAEGLLSSPDTRRQDEISMADDLSYPTKREVHPKFCDALYSGKRNASLNNLQNTGEGSSHPIAFDSNDGPLASVHASPGEMSDDAENTITGGAKLTLPALVDEILSKNQNMSYDELCEAVLPQWQNLRKNNGERYAYTSHCQAVLDCLRNRSAWAHLVDRGPKTGMGRKRRRIDPASAADSENEEDEQHTGTIRKLHDEGSERADSLASDIQKDIDITREDVPKGKRKARRRPLVFKRKERNGKFSRSSKDDKQSYSIDGLRQIPEQDEHEPFSDSSEDAESNYSENDHYNSARTVRMHLPSSDTSDDEVE